MGLMLMGNQSLLYIYEKVKLTTVTVIVLQYTYIYNLLKTSVDNIHIRIGDCSFEIQILRN